MEKRSERIWVNVTPRMKKQLREMADKERRSLSQLVYTILMDVLDYEESEIENEPCHSTG